MPRTHDCQNKCGETCDCGNLESKCTYCQSCLNADISAQCDYCTNRATLECPGCEDLFWCVEHESEVDNGCDTCRCAVCNTYPCECEGEDDDDDTEKKNDDD